MRPAIQYDSPTGDFQEITVGADFDLASEISETKRRHVDSANPEAQTDRSRGSRRLETEDVTRALWKQQMKHRKVSLPCSWLGATPELKVWGAARSLRQRGSNYRCCLPALAGFARPQSASPDGLRTMNPLRGNSTPACNFCSTSPHIPLARGRRERMIGKGVFFL